MSIYSGAAWDGIEITPANSDLQEPVRGLRVNGAGTLRITTAGGTVLNMTCYPGEYVPFFVKRVHSTGTTASGIIGGVDKRQ